MKHFPALVCAALAAVTFCSCSTPGVKFTQAEATIPKIPSGQSRLFFYRMPAFYGAGMRSPIFIDKVQVGRSIPGLAFYRDVPAGRHTISIDSYSSIADLGPNDKHVALADGETKYIRTWIGGSGFGGRTNMELVDERKALPAMRRLNLLPAP